MGAFITTAVLGVIICILGIINMSGNISSLHWYHRQRVSEENVKPFGKMVGLGTVIVGASVLSFSFFMFAFELTAAEIFSVIGAAIMLVGIAFGLAVSFYAMKKYNGGIF